MSQENVEIVRAALAAWNRRDWDEALKDAAPDVEVDNNSSNTGESRGVHRGPDEVETHTRWCWTSRDGTLTRLVASNELDDALEVAGLRE